MLSKAVSDNILLCALFFFVFYLDNFPMGSQLKRKFNPCVTHHKWKINSVLNLMKSQV